jgi:NitT/TauT family transport system permease protein
MSLVLFHTDKVRRALAAPASVGIEVFVLAGVAAAIGGIVLLASHAAEPMRAVVEINLSAWALPKYTLLTLLRGCAAYALSLGFTLVYGWIAAHNRRAERVMVPALDVLQAIPVLGFLPGLVLALVHLFPTREIGLELSCVIMIFTAQAWNMTFSFFGSLRGIPSTLREAAALQRLSGFQVFRILEVPASMIGLVWNSMMSMAGGWFFITVNEAFTLRDRDYRLPGLGSYMNEAINQGNVRAEVSAVVAMVVMIVIVDQVIWRPIVVWSERYKLEDTQAADLPKSWVMDLFHRSRIVRGVRQLVLARRRASATRQTLSPTVTIEPPAAARSPVVPARPPMWQRVGASVLKWAVLAALAVGAVWGCVILAKLLVALPVRQADHQDWLHVLLALLASLGRTMVAVLLGGLWALPAGILIGLSPKWSQRLQPVVQVVASFPAPMLFPLVAAALVLLHVPFTIGCVTLMLLGTQWYVLFNVIAGAMAIPSDLREAARVYRLSRVTVWRELYIPAVFPYLVTGLVTAAGGAWNATIVSEYLQTKADTFVAFGLGSTITEATNAGNFPLLAASIVTMAVFVVAINRVLWRRLYRLAEARYSLNL